MSKKSQVTRFVIESTEYGWAVRVGAARLGLFVTQKHAIADVKARQKQLRTEGSKSELSVIGEELEPSRPRLQIFRSR